MTSKLDNRHTYSYNFTQDQIDKEERGVFSIILVYL